MAKIKNIVELREFIIYLENKYNLLDFEIDGVKPWLLSRVAIDYDLGILLGIIDKPHSTVTNKDNILNIFKILKSAIFKNPFFAKPVDIVIFPHARVKEVDGEIVDIYTHYFEKELLEDDISFIEIEYPYIGKHLKKSKNWRYHKDIILLIRKVFYRFFKIKDINYDILFNIEQEIEDKVGKYDLINRFTTIVKYYKIEYILYRKLLKKINPKQIYIVPNYGGLGVVTKIAKDLNIEVLEFQHGNFSKYHFGYYFGEEKRKLDYFPDKFLVWNEYWKNLINFPINDENIIIKKFEFLENKKNNYKDINKVKNKVVVLSQGVIGEAIAKKILDNWDFFKKFDIKYKLHPGEYDRWQNYSSLDKLLKYENIEILKDIDLYELFSSCEYQIGVFSTALSEGVEFGCKTILLDLPGIEEMYKFKELYDVELI